MPLAGESDWIDGESRPAFRQTGLKERRQNMEMLMIGKALLDARERSNMTQEELAHNVGVPLQDVKKWEKGKSLPDIENLMLIAEVTNTPYQCLLMPDEYALSARNLQFRDRFFSEENMFTRVKTFALSEDLLQTYRALQFMRDQHMGQFRKKGKHSHELVQYINHPLLMTCQAHALGIRDDALLAALLLHDVVEDTDVSISDLPFSEEVRELVGLVTFFVPAGMTKMEAKEAYYASIKNNGKACVIKILDRCNNVSTMASSFKTKRMLEYINETERFVLPLADTLKYNYPEYSDIAFLIKYQIISVIETIKNLVVL